MLRVVPVLWLFACTAPDPGDSGDTDTDTDTDSDTDASCAPLPAPTGTVYAVDDVDALLAAVEGASAGDTITLAPGTYDLDGEALWIDQAITLRGATDDRDAAVLDGGYVTGSIVNVGVSDVTIAHLTLARSYYHPIHVSPWGGADIEGVVIHDVRITDPGEQAIKINTAQGGTRFADGGTVSCSHLELTGAGRAEVRNNCYTGGIDAHQARGWLVRDNRIEGFWCPSGLSEHGIHFWRGGRDTVIERNELRNNARGIGLGLGNDTLGRDWPDDPCGGAIAQDYGGLVRNNTVFADDAALFASAAGFDTGIALESACDATVLHNTVFSTQAPFSSIEYRFTVTSGVIANNLTSHDLRQRDGAVVTEVANLQGAEASWFLDASSGDLHLSAAASDAIDGGTSAYLAQCPDDLDRQDRTLPDVGADEAIPR